MGYLFYLCGVFIIQESYHVRVSVGSSVNLHMYIDPPNTITSVVICAYLVLKFS